MSNIPPVSSSVPIQKTKKINGIREQQSRANQHQQNKSEKEDGSDNDEPPQQHLDEIV